MVDQSVHSLRSSHREALIEHLFSGEIMKQLWRRGEWRLEVLKPQVDDGGYDLVLEANGLVRHVQLKASFEGSKIREAKVNTLLASKPSGCVVFVWFDADTLDLKRYAFLGGPPGEPLPDLGNMKVARHTKANALGVKSERPRIRTIPLTLFERLATIDDLVVKLFGPSETSSHVAAR